MDAFICITCGTQFAPLQKPPKLCPICSEERQFVSATGQAWTTLSKLSKSHMLSIRDEAGILGLGISPNARAGLGLIRRQADIRRSNRGYANLIEMVQ
jgi:hypothetical protein